MKSIRFLWLLLISTGAICQTPNRPLALNLPGYLGNPIEATITLSPLDTVKVISAKAYESDARYASLVAPQPTLSRTGLKLSIRFPASNLARAFVEIKVGDLIRYAGWLLVDKQTTASSPASLSAIQYITLKGDKGDIGPVGLTGPKGDPGNPATNLVTKVAGRQGDVQLMFADLVAHPNSAAGYGINDVYTKTQIDQVNTDQNTQIAGKLASSYSTTQALVDGGQNAQIDLKANVLDVYTKTQVDQANTTQNAQISLKANATDVYTKTQADQANTDQNNQIGQKANSADVYPKSQTYSQAETDAKKADVVIVGTFSQAQAAAVAGKPKVFILTNDAAYGGSSVVIWSGSSFSVLPAIPRTN